MQRIVILLATGTSSTDSLIDQPSEQLLPPSGDGSGSASWAQARSVINEPVTVLIGQLES